MALWAWLLVVVSVTCFYGFEQFLANPIWLFQVWTGGMSFRRLLGVMLAMLFGVKIQNDLVPNPRLYCAMLYLQGSCFGRIGNFIGGIYGRPVADPNFFTLGMILTDRYS